MSGNCIYVYIVIEMYDECDNAYETILFATQNLQVARNKCEVLQKLAQKNDRRSKDYTGLAIIKTKLINENENVLSYLKETLDNKIVEDFYY
jgi:hypothetical protein